MSKDSELEQELRNLHQFFALQRERSAHGARKSRIHRSDYGALSETSYYRRQSVADRTLSERVATEEELAAARSRRDPNARVRTTPVYVNGRVVH
jgi:hypothetical protein